MSIINICEVDTGFGFKSIELVHDNILEVRSVDILVISAIRGAYIPLENTVIGHLDKKLGLKVSDVLQDVEFDFREKLCCWVSKELTLYNFKRIAGLEFGGKNTNSENIEKVVRNFFSFLALMELQGISTTSVAMPLVGTGHQGIPPTRVLPILLELSQVALKKIPSLKKIMFVELDYEKVSQFDEGINKLLSRRQEELQSVNISHLNTILIEDLSMNLVRVESFLSRTTSAYDIRCKLSEDRIRMYEIGILVRRLLEEIVFALLEEERGSMSLFEGINRLKATEVAPWMISYMHSLRTFGNTVAHSNRSSSMIFLESKDILIALFIVNRVVSYFLTKNGVLN